MLGSAAYRVAAGRTHIVHIALSSSLNLRHAVVASVTSREQGLKGSETVTRRIRLHI
jgi:hypothetical protein